MKAIAENGIDVSKFSLNQHTYIVGHVSTSCQEVKFLFAQTPPATIKQDVNKMIASGKLLLGQPCAPYLL